MKLRPFYKVHPHEWILTTNNSKKQELNELQPDNESAIEYTNQWLIQELNKSYQYPLEWITNRIVRGDNRSVFSDNCTRDLLFFKSLHGHVFLIFGTLPSNCSDSEFILAEKEFEQIFLAYPTSRLGCITRGVETKVVRRNSGTNTFEYISDLPDFKTSFGKGVSFSRVSTSSKGLINVNSLTPLPRRIKNLFFEIHSTIRDIDGLHDDNALDEMCKLLYAKIYDENNDFSTNLNLGLKYLFQLNENSNESEVAAEIRGLYTSACVYDIQKNASIIPGYERSRGVFKESLNLSDSALSKIVEKLQMYSITESDNDIKSQVFQQVLGRAIRSGMGQFFTPDEIVQLAVEVTSPKPTDLILDPFCGSGHFLSRSIDYVTKHYSSSSSPDSVHKFKLHNLHGIEKSPRMVRIAITDMLLHNDGHTNIRNTDALATPNNFPDIQVLTENSSSESLSVFDLILTNPPFGKLIGDETSSSIDSFELAQKRKSVPFEIIALERCYHFLKKGGKLAIVLPDGNLANSQTQYVRDWLLANFILKAVVSLPSETFAPYGTTTKTSLCFFQKFKDLSDTETDYDIAFYKLDNIGYDATGRELAGSEVPDAIAYLCKTIEWD